MTAGIIRFLLTNFPLTFFLAGLCCTVVKIYRHRINITGAFIAEVFAANYFLWSLGISHIYNAIMHITFPATAANYIGWANSPFQLEVGFASLGIGIAALMAYKKDYRVRLAIVIATSVFLWGCAAGHFYQVSKFHNEAPGNAGLALWVDLIQPVISIVLLVISHNMEKHIKPLHLFTYRQKTFIAIPVEK